jgi:hypothetical protein
MRSRIAPRKTFVLFHQDGTEFGRLDPEMTQRLLAEAQARGLSPAELFVATIAQGLESERRRKKRSLPSGVPPAAEKIIRWRSYR